MEPRTVKQYFLARHSWFVVVGGLVVAACAQAADPAAAPTLVPSEDGASVIDLRARLVWPRCVEGMQWTGKTCTGTPQRLDYAQATALAHARWKADGVRWRLPRVNELKRLVDKTARPPGPNPVLFPATPPDWHWSGTANVQMGSGNPYNYGNVMESRAAGGAGGMAFRQGWAVNMATGESRADVGKGSRLLVRLVRPHEPVPAPAEGAR
jgi:hypothetical protein